jgi:hypothetical protein
VRIFKILAGFLFCSAVWAADVSLTCTAPTTRTDGSPLTNLAGYRIKYGTVSGTYPTVIDKQGAVCGPYTVSNLTGGVTYFFVMSAYDANALESANSNQVSRTVLIAPPNPPGGLTVTALIAYTVVKQTDRLVMLPVGSVPGDTQCIASQALITDDVMYHAVPRASVTWSGSVRPVIVFARCV